MNFASILAAAALAAAGAVAFADEEDDIVGSLTSEETEKVVAFGRGVGQAYACAADADKTEMFEDIRMIFNFVAQDMGTDAAFVYATVVGYGAKEGAADCAERAEQWADVLEQFDLSDEGE